MKFSRVVYITIIASLIVLLTLDFIPSCKPYTAFVSPTVVLFLGLLYALIFGKVFPSVNKKVSKKLLQYSIIGLGFGMNVEMSLQSGLEGMSMTIISVVGTLILGMIIGVKCFGIDKKISYLISSGTAVCGGSAIAAVAPVIKAEEEEVSVALGAVFILNAVALFIFPTVGRYLEMSQEQFGLWSAIAIHDTSSVVGAASAYGQKALELATMVKLTRALWIIPLSLVSAVLFHTKGTKISIPYFILFFVLAMVLNTYALTDYAEVTAFVSTLAKKGLTLTMFFIGASLSLDTIKSLGLKVLLMAIALWLSISLLSLAFIML